MGLKSTYTCDKCGHEQPTSDQMWNLGVSLDHVGPIRPPSQPSKTVMWCRACVEEVGLLQIPNHEPQRELPPPPTLEDLIREIAEQVVQERTGA